MLTSSGTTNPSAAGVVIVLKAASPTADHTAFVKYGSLQTKFNTADFQLMQGGYYLLEDGSGRYQLEDGSGALLIDTVVPSLGDPVRLTNPTWSGRVVSVTRRDITDMRTNYREISVAATNQLAVVASAGPGDFSDVPGGGYFTLEDSSGRLQLEDASGLYELEGTSYGYRSLSVQASQNQDGTVTTYGSLETFEGGFAAGQTFLLTSQNLGYAAAPFTITNVTQTFIGAAITGQPTPGYLIEFGDAYQTLQQAGGGILTRQAGTATQALGVAMPGGVLGYAQVTANQTGISTITDLTGLTVTVTVVSGRRIKITSFARIIQNTAAAAPTLHIYEGATRLAYDPVSLGIGAQIAASAFAILTPTAGVHTYKLALSTGAGTVDLTAAADVPAFILVEDAGN